MTDNTTRTMLITGATGGMGTACALQAAQQGYRLILADLSQQKLADVAAQCANYGVDVDCRELDVTNDAHITALCDAARDKGGIDAIIHTVGISPTMGSWQKVIEIDLIGTARFLEAIRPHINQGGAVVGISSMSAYMCAPNPALESLLVKPLEPGLLDTLKGPTHEMIQNPGMAYSYAKKALKDYVAANAFAWGREGKRLVSIAPGLIDTAMGRQENAAHEEGFNAMKQMMAIDRMGLPEDIANTALFLASPQAAYITGVDILVDGGIVATMQQMQRQPF